jgi:hypothetical protein
VVVIAWWKPLITVNELRTTDEKLASIPPHGMSGRMVVRRKARSLYEFAALYWFTRD